MSIKNRLKEDMTQAIKGGDTKTRDTIRMMLAPIQNLEIKVKREVNEDEVTMLLQTFKKQVQEESLAYLNAGNVQRHDELNKDIKLVEKYLPVLMSEEDIKQLISLTVSDLESQGVSVNKGLIMKTIMPQVKGKADNKLVMEIVSSIFG